MKHGTIRTFCAFGDFGRIPADIRRALQQSGISTLDTSSGRKDAADKAIIVELCFFAVDHQSPATVILITGDRDYSNTLQRLKQHRYRVLVFGMAAFCRDPSLLGSSEDRKLYDWLALASRGEAITLTPSPGQAQPRNDESFGSLGRPLSAGSTASSTSSGTPQPGPARQASPANGTWLVPRQTGVGGGGFALAKGAPNSAGSPMSWHALKASPLGRAPFQEFLAASPSGIDGGTVNKWLTSHVGGIDTFGYSSFKDLMRAAETAGLCRLGGTKSLYVYAPQQPQQPQPRQQQQQQAVDPVFELQKLLTLVQVEELGEGSVGVPMLQPQLQQQQQQQPQQQQSTASLHSRSSSSGGGPQPRLTEPHIPGWLIHKIRTEFWNGRREEVTQPYTRLVQWLNREVSGGYHTLGYKKWTVFLHDAERAGAWVLGPPESEWASERGLKTVRPPGSAAHTPSQQHTAQQPNNGRIHHLQHHHHHHSPLEGRIPVWLLSKLSRDFWEGGREEVAHPYLPLIQWLNAELEGGYSALGYKKLTPFLEEAERCGAVLLVPPESEWAAERGLKTLRPLPGQVGARGGGRGEVGGGFGSGQARAGGPGPLGPRGTIPQWLLDQLQTYLLTKPNLRQGVYAPYMPISYFLQQRTGGLEKMGFPNILAFLEAAEAGGALRLSPAKSPNSHPVVRPVHAKPPPSSSPSAPSRGASATSNNNAITAAAAAAAWKQDLVDSLPHDLHEESLINLGFAAVSGPGDHEANNAINLALGMSAFGAPGGARWI